MDDLDNYLSVALDSVRKAGKLIMDSLHSKSTMSVQQKSSSFDLVTKVDQTCEHIITLHLKEHFPNHGFLGEETADAIEGLVYPLWVLDPIDGTMNYVHGFPMFAISLGLLLGPDKPILGIIFNPLTQQLLYASEGKGAFLNGERVYVSKCKEAKEAIVLVEYGSDRQNKEWFDLKLNNMITLLNTLNVHAIRVLGSSASDLLLVGTGACDAYVDFGMHIWDIAAGAVIVKEAGGTVIDPSGGKLDLFSRRILAASSDGLANEIVSHCNYNVTGLNAESWK